jgi:hypothetical protein
MGNYQMINISELGSTTSVNVTLPKLHRHLFQKRETWDILRPNQKADDLMAEHLAALFALSNIQDLRNPVH